jgi:murein L,D-transpeptidase YafK
MPRISPFLFAVAACWLATPARATDAALTPDPGLAAKEALAVSPAKVTVVRVDKSERRIYLMADGRVIRSYRISLGGNPVGPKRQEGDEKTPEGNYVIDWRNPTSVAYRSMHISYPNAEDRAYAREKGVSPGGNIMIHGQHNGIGWLWWIAQNFDWTNGCIGVANHDMDEIIDLVSPGTPIVIGP